MTKGFLLKQNEMIERYDPVGTDGQLELGAGSSPTPGYIHNDIRPLNHIEIVCDIREIANYVKSGWTTIKMAHCLEHFSPAEAKKIVKICYDLLAFSGALTIDVPNFKWQTKAHTFQEISDEEAVYFIYGEQDYEENTHRNGFTEASLTKLLTDTGFRAIVNDIGQVLIGTGVKWED